MLSSLINRTCRTEMQFCITLLYLYYVIIKNCRIEHQFIFPLFVRMWCSTVCNSGNMSYLVISCIFKTSLSILPFASCL